MANIKQQKKRILVTRKENEINKSKRSRVKNIVKKYEAAIAEKNIELATQMLPEVVSVIDKAKSDGVYKQNTASRKVARLSKMLSDLQKAE
ncbi:MAG TPA: 30S ribosomal protein S20 [Clostridia bacterium]|jgi:small subunit ribosomal protein S20|nr:30S ribosomal protein S20 [Clostridia bacterium]HOK81638.1 30S ribosomal protein S20 [Clostridia bacterium]HOL60535.1 30S ribosomal protein S20 [Clostridia bacterium]HPO52942.1 30S ribosomal protein S20 [Clostridia bacterium]